MIDFDILEKGSFVQRILLLDQVEKEGDAAHIPPLTALYGKESLDESLRQALGDTLRAVLAKNPSAIIEILENSEGPELKMAIQLASQLALAGSADPLSRLALKLPPGEELILVYSALGKVAKESAAGIFRKGAISSDPFLASEAILQLGELKDNASSGLLSKILDDAESEEKYEYCSLATASAIEALAKLTEPEAINSLVRKIHHRNPTVRTLIHAVLVERGESVIEQVGAFMRDGDTDEKIMAAGLLGLIGSPRGAQIMLSAMDTGQLTDQNVRLAVYDAFGSMPSLKTMICLVDGLDETDEMTLVSVVTSLNRMINPGLAAKVGSILAAGQKKGKAVARAIISAHALETFKAVYNDPEASRTIMEQLCASNNQEARGLFAGALKEIGGERANSDAKLVLGYKTEGNAKKRVLAVDDSRSIILFYKTVLAELGLEVVTAEHGKAALGVMGASPAFDLVITDMNMPEMNGIELTRKIRENPFFDSIPVVMASTETDESQKIMADRAGVNGYLVKPIKPEDLEKLAALYLSDG